MSRVRVAVNLWQTVAEEIYVALYCRDTLNCLRIRHIDGLILARFEILGFTKQDISLPHELTFQEMTSMILLVITSCVHLRS